MSHFDAEASTQKLVNKIRNNIQASDIELIDDSARHAGHAGSRPGGATHYKLKVVSDAFAGLSRIERHRLIYTILADELRDHIHALNIEAKTPQEAGL